MPSFQARQPAQQAQPAQPNAAGNPFLGGILPPSNPNAQMAANNLSNALTTQAQEDSKPPTGQANASAGDAATSGVEYPEVSTFL